MPDQDVPIPIPVRGDLDTANPIGDRPYGTLVTALDVSPRYWGPRVGSKAFTRVWEGPGTAALYDNITLNATNDCYGSGRSYEDQFRNLGVDWTLDLYFRLDETAYAVGLDYIGVYYFSAGGIGNIQVHVLGPNQGANEGKVFVQIFTSETLIKADPVKTLTSTNVISTGTTQIYNHHVRVVKDGTTATLYIDGLQEAQDTTLLNSPLNSNYGTYGDVYIGYAPSSDTSFKGQIFGAVLRDGAFDAQPIEALMPHSAWARNVHHYILGRNIALGGSNDHFFDAGRFGVHPQIVFTAGGDYTITAANEDAPPAPAITQGLASWTTRNNRTATSAMVGGKLSTAFVT